MEDGADPPRVVEHVHGEGRRGPAVGDRIGPRAEPHGRGHAAGAEQRSVSDAYVSTGQLPQPEVVREVVDEAYERFTQLAGRRRKLAATLSGGERQRDGERIYSGFSITGHPRDARSG